MKYRKKPVVIEATQWFKNGDHPEDYANPVDLPDDKGDKVWHANFDKVTVRYTTYTPEYQRENDWEGQVVRRYRHPDYDGQSKCPECGFILHVHGWIDTLEQGHRVCPGDYIITGVKGERYPCKPDIFVETYEEFKL